MAQSRIKFSVIFAVAFAAILALGLIGCSSESSEGTEGDDVDVDVEEVEPAIYAAGTYEAAGEGLFGDVVVSVTFSDYAIESIVVTEHNETESLGGVAAEELPGTIVDAQSLAVDGISGATVTSDAIIDAVADCVEQAGGDVDALMAAE